MQSVIWSIYYLSSSTVPSNFILCFLLSTCSCHAAGLTGEEKEEGAKAKEQLDLDQGDDGEEGGNYKTQNQFHTHLKKQQVFTLLPLMTMT